MKNLLLVLFLLCKTVSISLGQTWHYLAGLSSEVSLKQVEVSLNGDIYVLTEENNVFYSQDQGISWIPASPPPFPGYTANARAFHFNNASNTLFIGTSMSGLSWMKSYGQNWSQEWFSTSNPSGMHESVLNITSLGNQILVSGNASLGNGQQRYFFSSNNGTSWSNAKVGYGLAEDLMIDSLGHWLIATSTGLQRTPDQGQNWQVLAFSGKKTRAIEKTPAGTYYLLVNDSLPKDYTLYSSTDLQNWLPRTSFSTTAFHDMGYSGQFHSLYIATDSGLFLYDITGNSLNQVGMMQVLDASETTNGSVVITSQTFSGLGFSNAPSFNWTYRKDGMMRLISYSDDRVMINDSQILSTSSISRLLSNCNYFSNAGCNSEFVHDTANTDASPNAFLFQDPAGNTYSGGRLNIYRKTNHGWRSLTSASGLPAPASFTGLYSISYFGAGRNNDIFVAQETDSLKVWRSTDNGNSWISLLNLDTVLQMGLPYSIRVNGVLSDTAGNIYASITTMALDYKLLKKPEGGAWTDITPGSFSLVNSPVKLIAGKDEQIYAYSNKELFTISQSTISQVQMPFQTGNQDINLIYPAIDSAGTIYLNVSRLPGCSQCGVYKKNSTNWDYLGFPPAFQTYLPLREMLLAGDTLPIVKTAYSYLEGPINLTGFYYFSVNPINPSETTSYTVNEEWSVFPNPNTGTFTLSGSGELRVTILDIQGRVRHKTKIDHSRTISVNLPSGIYLIMLEKAGKTRMIRKLIVK